MSLVIRGLGSSSLVTSGLGASSVEGEWIFLQVTGATAQGTVGSTRLLAVAPVAGAEAQGATGSAPLTARIPVTGVEAHGTTGSVLISASSVPIPVAGAEAHGTTGSILFTARIPATGAEATGTVGSVRVAEVVAILATGAEAHGDVSSVRISGRIPLTSALGQSTIGRAQLLARIPVSGALGYGDTRACPVFESTLPKPRPTPNTQMLTVTKITVRSFNLDHLDVFWEIETVAGPRDWSGDHDVLQFDFYVLRSEQAEGPYVVVGGPLRDRYQFRDTAVSLLHKWRHYYYKLRAVHRFSGESAEFGPSSSYEPEPDLLAAEMIRQEDVLFREFIGRKCWLFPARTFGARCSCFDPVLQRKTRAEHLPCFCTGWFGGYLSPVEIYVQIDPNPKQTQVQTLDEGQVSVTTARTSSFPPISPRDILVETKNRRWRVVNVTPTQRLRATVHQELSLYEIPKGDIAYAIPLTIDASSVTPASERNFTNKQNVGPDDLSDILSFWSNKPRGSVL